MAAGTCLDPAGELTMRFRSRCLMAGPIRSMSCAVSRVKKIVPNAATPKVAPIDRKNCTVAVALPMSRGWIEFCMATR